MKQWMICLAGKAKLNLWLLLTLFLCAGTCLVAIHDLSNFDNVRYRLNCVCATADSAYRRGGSERLSMVLESIDQGLGIQPRLLDLSGRDLANGADRSAWLVYLQRRGVRLPAH